MYLSMQPFFVSKRIHCVPSLPDTFWVSATNFDGRRDDYITVFDTQADPSREDSKGPMIDFSQCSAHRKNRQKMVQSAHKGTEYLT